MNTKPKVTRGRKSSKNYWTLQRDKMLGDIVKIYGGKLNWNQMSIAFPDVNGKCIKQRYRRYLDISTNYSKWTEEQNQLIKNYYIRHGNKWQQLARLVPGRSLKQIQNQLNKLSVKYKFRDENGNFQDMIKITGENAKASFKSEEIKGKKVIVPKKYKENKPQRVIQRKQKVAYQSEKAVVNYMDMMINLINQDIKMKKFEHLPAIFLSSEHIPLSEKQIISQLLNIQWVLTNLWAQLGQEPAKATREEQIYVFLYSLYKERNQNSKKMLDNLANCYDNEDYLIDHLGELVENIEKFNQSNLKIYKNIGQNEKEDENLWQLDIDEDLDYYESTPNRNIYESQDQNISKLNFSTFSSQINLDNLQELMESNEQQPNTPTNSNNSSQILSENHINFTYEEPESDKEMKPELSCSSSLSLF